MRPRVLLSSLVLILALTGAWFAVRAWLESRVAEAIDFQIGLLPPAVSVQYEDVSVDLPSLRTHVHDVAVRLGRDEPPILIDRLTVHAVDREHRLPRFLDMELTGVARNLVDSTQFHARFLRRYGVEQVRGRVALKYRFDEEARRLEVQQLLVDLHPVGRLDVSARLRTAQASGVPLQDWRPEEVVALERLTASWVDAGLVEHVMVTAAASQGMTPETLALNIAAELERTVAATETPRLDQSVDTLVSFLASPGAVTAHLDPPEPLPLTELRDTALVNPPRAAVLTRLRVEPGRWRD